VKETLHCSNGLDETRVRRAFGWVVTFRDFPARSFQTVDGDSMMTEALTLFTKGRAEFYLNGDRRGDRVPGTLSSEHEVVGQGGTFKLVYVEPTTRVCIPANINNHKLPIVSKFMFEEEQHQVLQPGKYLVCLGVVAIADREFTEERSFELAEPKLTLAMKPSILLQFHDSRR